MKKIYALAAALLACGTMSAAPVMSKVKMDDSMRYATMTQEGQALMRAESAYMDYVADNEIELPGTQKFSYTDPTTGKVWNARVAVTGQWTENFNFDSTHIGYYCCKLQVQLFTGEGSTYTRMVHMLVYPRVDLFKKEYWGQVFGADLAENFTEDSPVPLQSWESNSAFVTNFKQVLSGRTGDVAKFVVPAASTDANNFQLASDNDGLAIMNANTPTGQGNMWWQASTSMGWAQVNNNQVQTGCVGEGSSLKFSQYDPETNTVDIPFVGNVVNASNTKTFIYDVKYSGEAKILGFQPFKSVVLSEMHIAYYGEKSNANDENYDDAEWGPLAQYGVYGAGPDYFWGNWDGSNPNHTIPQLYKETENAVATMFKGLVYSPAGNTDGQGTWYAKMYESERNPISGDYEALEGPTAWTFPMGGLVMVFSETEGLTCAVDGDNWWMKGSNYPEANDNVGTYVISGGTAGSGIQGYSGYTTILTMGIPEGTDIIYHYDATDLSKTRKIANIGAIENPEGWRPIVEGVSTINSDNVNANITTENGKIIVTVDADANVAVYNMAGMAVKNVKAVKGQRVVIDAANGLYIVRVGNKAAKVIL